MDLSLLLARKSIDEYCVSDRIIFFSSFISFDQLCFIDDGKMASKGGLKNREGGEEKRERERGKGGREGHDVTRSKMKVQIVFKKSCRRKRDKATRELVPSMSTRREEKNEEKRKRKRTEAREDETTLETRHWATVCIAVTKMLACIMALRLPILPP